MIPGVSEKITWKSGLVNMPLIRCRVVCTFGEVIASFSPRSAFNNVLFPAFGLPDMDTNPARMNPLAPAQCGQFFRSAKVEYKNGETCSKAINIGCDTLFR